jgi:hypothetical protein
MKRYWIDCSSILRSITASSRIQRFLSQLYRKSKLERDVLGSIDGIDVQHDLEQS